MVPRISGRMQGSRHDLDLAASWLRQCQSHHSECHGDGSGLYPTRLLRLVGTGTETKLVLVESVESAQSPGPYTALSHCWGSVQPLKTTSENYKRHISGIEYSELPRSFQDAVLVTRSLSVEYLWIDSLCIIQDSKQDWQRECPRMVTVYSNSLLTIAAADAADSCVGFLSDYSPPLFPSVELLAVVVEYSDGRQETIGSTWKTVLSKRGWALQERLLSPRVLSFRRNRLVWQCNDHTRSDDQHYPITIERVSFGDLKRQLMDGLDEWGLLDYWCDVVRVYSQCQLTLASDKLPALSGLANQVSQRLKKPYLAGIWQDDFHIGLSWYNQCDCTKSSPFLSRTAEEQAIVNGPSWSWAQSACEVEFRTDMRTQHLDMSLLAADLSLVGIDPFGEVTSGTLRVSARLRMGFIGFPDPSNPRRDRCHLYDTQNDRAAKARFEPDCRQASKFDSMSLNKVEVSALLITSCEVVYATAQTYYGGRTHDFPWRSDRLPAGWVTNLRYWLCARS